MTLPTETVKDSDARRCGCCGRDLPSAQVAELGSTPGVFICAGCALWAARRAGLLSALRRVRLRSVLPRRGRRGPHSARTAIPVLPSGDLDRTATFYSHVGFEEVERHEGYLLLHNDGVELHFTLHEVVVPGTCFVHVVDATKLWKQLRDLGVDGVGELADQDYGLREFTVTDPDGNRVRLGGARP
jgi:catechol 2,3-dioxygenase-like lactoylglutathione lyase family enzyme